MVYMYIYIYIYICTKTLNKGIYDAVMAAATSNQLTKRTHVTAICNLIIHNKFKELENSQSSTRRYNVIKLQPIRIKYNTTLPNE